MLEPFCVLKYDYEGIYHGEARKKAQVTDKEQGVEEDKGGHGGRVSKAKGLDGTTSRQPELSGSGAPKLRTTCGIASRYLGTFQEL